VNGDVGHDRRVEAVDQPLILVGHSHIPLAISYAGDAVAGGLAEGGAEIELRGARWLLNPGSVGQPRDGDPRAAYLLLEPGKASFRRVEYPIAATQAEMRAAGLPGPLTERLAFGR
jgi:diadenosine tetraphosphatase ApaH/serine/threonine PP2A family protein phosphatase